MHQPIDCGNHDGDNSPKFAPGETVILLWEDDGEKYYEPVTIESVRKNPNGVYLYSVEEYDEAFAEDRLQEMGKSETGYFVNLEFDAGDVVEIDGYDGEQYVVSTDAPEVFIDVIYRVKNIRDPLDELEVYEEDIRLINADTSSGRRARAKIHRQGVIAEKVDRMLDEYRAALRAAEAAGTDALRELWRDVADGIMARLERGEHRRDAE